MKLYLALLAVLLSLNTANAETFNYIYIEANEGAASGGHVAVQFGDEVFHYQYQDGLIRLFKQDAEGFYFDYRYLQNRSLHVAAIEVSGQTFNLLRDQFKLLFWQQQRQFKQLQTTQTDRQLLQWLQQFNNSPALAQSTDKPLKLQGAGLFFSDSDFGPDASPQGECQTADSSTSILTLLRGQLESKYGSGFLQQRQRELIEAMHQLSAVASADQAYSLTERYTDQLNGLLAVRVLLETRPLTADACHVLAESEWQLNARKLEQLKTLQLRLLESARNLTVSKRPDWGYALFVTLGRLIALEHSIRTGLWVFLDDFSEDSPVIGPEEFIHFPAEMRLQHQEAETGWQQERLSFDKNIGIDEQQYSHLEAAANRYHEWLLSDNRHSLRYHGEQALPVKALRLPAIVLPQLSTQQLEEALRRNELSADRLNRQLKSRYAYHLLTRNCVTEIFSTLHQALGTETRQLLGGVIDENLYIAPFAAFEKVLTTYPVNNVVIQPSYRQQQLAQQYEQNFAPLVYFRESNILSAELYNYHADDTFFVFFTDDAILPRPLFGAINALAGFGQSIFGLLQWPFDNGHALTTGMRGVVMSLPELAFMNIRKGSYKFVSPVSVPQ